METLKIFGEYIKYDDRPYYLLTEEEKKAVWVQIIKDAEEMQLKFPGKGLRLEDVICI